jgi:hypothetical protein
MRRFPNRTLGASVRCHITKDGNLPDPTVDWETPFGRVEYIPKTSTTKFIPWPDSPTPVSMRLKRKYVR